MNMISRRSFVQGTASTALLAALGTPRRSTAAAAGQKLKIGFIGCGNRALTMLRLFQDAQIVWACDPDAQRAKEFQQRSDASHQTADMRRVLDDPAVQAVVIATPDHWHAPAAILACQAGKHVYLEKPCCHNLQEGRWLVEAARTHNVVMQHGTQSRTNPFIAGAIQMLREGRIGEVLAARAWNVQRRASIERAQPSEPPAGVDYDTWVGPVEFVPFQKNRFHYDWRWWHHFGTGDIGNDGTHEIDIARWGLGVTGFPTRVAALGGKSYFDDDQQFPDTAVCTYEWPAAEAKQPRRQLTFEMRLWSRNYPYNCDSGVEFFGTKGMLFVSKRGKLQVYGDDNRLVPDAAPAEVPKLPANHAADFFEAIEQKRPPAADIVTGFDSVALVHLANIAIRVGKTLHLDPARQAILDDPASNKLFGRAYRAGGHWAIPSGN